MRGWTARSSSPSVCPAIPGAPKEPARSSGRRRSRWTPSRTRRGPPTASPPLSGRPATGTATPRRPSATGGSRPGRGPLRQAVLPHQRLHVGDVRVYPLLHGVSLVVRHRRRWRADHYPKQHADDLPERDRPQLRAVQPRLAVDGPAKASLQLIEVVVNQRLDV